MSSRPDESRPLYAAPDPDATMAPTPGDGRPGNTALAPPGYEILGELGRGGMGVVYRARQVKAGRVVALKMILSGGHAGEDELARFRREAEAIARLQHPGIVQVFEVGEHDGLPFFSLEFCGGGSLDRKLAGTPLPAREAAALVEALARAMQAAHEAGVVHRDLKPANVLLAGQPGEGTEANPLAGLVPKITDFGLAKRLDAAGQTQTGAVMGTPSYIAPEQAEGKKSVGPLADVYSLGAILYECLTGRPPFLAATMMDTLMQVVSQEPVSVRQLQAKVPPDLETICHKCLQKDPRKRYGSALDLADDLRRFLDGRPIVARPVGRVERLWRWCKREPVVATLLAAVLVVLAAGATVSGMLAVQARREAERADEKADEAEENAVRAREEARRADAKAGEALRNEKEALAQKEKAEKEKKRADGQKDRVEAVLYARRLDFARSASQQNNSLAAIRLLEECPWHLRGWEHRYLWTLFNSYQQNLSLRSGGEVAWSPDGRRIATRGSGVQVWDADTGQELLAFQGDPGGPSEVAYSPDGRRIITGCSVSPAMVWDADKGQELFALKTNIWNRSVAYSPDGRRIATNQGDLGGPRIFDARTGEPLLDLKGSGGHSLVRFSPDGRRVASGGEDGTVRVWDPETVQELLTLKGHTSGVLSVAYSPDGRRIASGDWDGTVKVWDAARSQEILALKGHTGRVYSVALSPDGRRIASGGENDHTVRVWDADKGQQLFVLEGHTECVRGLAFSPDGGRIASGCIDRKVRVWDAGKGQRLLTLEGDTLRVERLAFSPDGRRIAAVGEEYVRGPGAGAGMLRVWDADKGKELLTLRVARQSILGLAYSQDGTRIATWGRGGVIVSDARTGQRLHTLEGHKDGVTCVAFLGRDGRRIAYGDLDGDVRVWDADRGQELLALEGLVGRGSAMAHGNDGRRFATMEWGPDGRRIATGGEDGVTIWDARTGQRLLTLEGPGGKCSRLAFSSDGRRIAAVEEDGTVRVWDASKSQEILPLRGHPGTVTSVAWSTDGSRIVSREKDGRRLAWDRITGHPVPDDDTALPPQQKQARHPTADLLVRAEGNLVLVQPLRLTPEPWRAPGREEMIAFHREQARDAEQRRHPFAAAFHLERLHRLQPFDAPVRARLLAALEHAPDSPARRAVRQRLLAFDAARQAGVVGLAPLAALPALAASGRSAKAGR
jgi:WD40 repeat protein